MDKLYVRMGLNMREVRKARRMTQAQLAEAAGIDASFYGQIERGKNIPSLKTFLAISRALGAEPSDLLPQRSRRRRAVYAKTIERLVADLQPGRRRLALGMIGDLVKRLKR